MIRIKKNLAIQTKKKETKKRKKKFAQFLNVFLEGFGGNQINNHKHDTMVIECINLLY